MLPSSKMMSGERKECDGVGDGVGGAGSIKGAGGTVNAEGITGVNGNDDSDSNAKGRSMMCNGSSCCFFKSRICCLSSTCCCCCCCCWRGK